MRLAASIPGDADDEQLVAFIEAMRHAPSGDVIEIGSGGGRTAALLAWLARRFQVGAVLCRDDWRPETLADFEIAVAPVAGDRLNYLCGRDAAGYGPGFAATTSTFGETRYQGRIALLHLATEIAEAGDLACIRGAGRLDRRQRRRRGGRDAARAGLRQLQGGRREVRPAQTLATDPTGRAILNGPITKACRVARGTGR